MSLGRRRAALGAAATVFVSVLSFVSVAGQTPPASPQMSDAVFNNVQILKGIPVDEFMDTMGMFAASLGYDCVSCHSPDISTNRDAFAEDTPLIQRAREMIMMTNSINRAFFAGEPRMSCFTCHRGQNFPDNVPSLALQYAELVDNPSAMRIFPDNRTTPEGLLARYLEVAGGAQAAGLTSYVARGTYEGYNTGGVPFPVEIYGSAPDRRTQIVRTPFGDAVKTFDGEQGWVAEGWRPLPLMALTGGNLEAAELEAAIAFPSNLEEMFAQWQTSTTFIDDRLVRILQGVNPDALPVNFYFDDESGLLVRIVRWNRTAVGTVPMQVDFSDYRAVAGVQMPFRTVLTWTDGQNTFELTDVQPNVAIDPTRFDTPAPYEAQSP